MKKLRKVVIGLGLLSVLGGFLVIGKTTTTNIASINPPRTNSIISLMGGSINPPRQY